MADINTARNVIIATESVVNINEPFFNEISDLVQECIRNISKTVTVSELRLSSSGKLLSLTDISDRIKENVDETVKNNVLILSDDNTCTTRCGNIDIPSNVNLTVLSVDYGGDDCTGWEEISKTFDFAGKQWKYAEISADKIKLNSIFGKVVQQLNLLKCTELEITQTYTVPTIEPDVPTCTTVNEMENSSDGHGTSADQLSVTITIGCLAGVLFLVLLACMFVVYKNRKNNRIPDSYRQYSQVDQSVMSQDFKLPRIADAHPNSYDEDIPLQQQGWYEEIIIREARLNVEDGDRQKRLSTTKFIPRGPLMSPEDDDNIQNPFVSVNDESEMPINDERSPDQSETYFVLEKNGSDVSKETGKDGDPDKDDTSVNNTVESAGVYSVLEKTESVPKSNVNDSENRCTSSTGKEESEGIYNVLEKTGSDPPKKESEENYSNSNKEDLIDTGESADDNFVLEKAENAISKENTEADNPDSNNVRPCQIAQTEPIKIPGSEPNDLDDSKMIVDNQENSPEN